MIIWKKVNLKYKFIKKSAFNSKKWVSIINKRLTNNFKNLRKTRYLDQFLASTPLPLIIINDNKVPDKPQRNSNNFLILNSLKNKDIFLDFK